MCEFRNCGLSVVLLLAVFAGASAAEQPSAKKRPAATGADALKERFGEQQFVPAGGFVIRVGQTLPNLVWTNPRLVATVVADPAIPTRWFDETLTEVKTAKLAGRYYAYGDAPVPAGPPLRRAMTCCCVEKSAKLQEIAGKYIALQKQTAGARQPSATATSLVSRWRTTEAGAVELAAFLKAKQQRLPPRKDQWQMEDATRHVRLKRKLMGLQDKPIVKATAIPISGKPAPVLRKAPLEQAGVSPAQVRAIQSQLDAWYAASRQPMAVVIARKGVVILARAFGKTDGRTVTIDTPMLLHSAMKPLIGLQLAMYVDRGHLRLDEPIGDYLPDFKSRSDRLLTFRAGHVHATGIHFPWKLAFKRLFYFHTWHESLIAHCRREWAPGSRYRYGVVGVILSVRALELLRGRNYWDAMERDMFAPLGIKNVLPGGQGFSAENLARIGVLLDNRGKYGKWQLFSEQTYEAIIPRSLEPYFPKLSRKYGIGLQDASRHLGAGSYGHGGGCGTLLVVNPNTHLVFAMVRNHPGKDYAAHRSRLMTTLRELRFRE